MLNEGMYSRDSSCTANVLTRWAVLGFLGRCGEIRNSASLDHDCRGVQKITIS